MNGWTGKILHVDLSSRSSRAETPTAELYQKYIGGKGLAGYYLQDAVTEPFDSPNMPVIFMTGPLVGTASPTSGRMCVMSKSPLTGTVGDASVGGSLGTQIKKAGWDGVIITGKSDAPCGIEIVDGELSFHDASTLVRKPTEQVFEELKDRGCVATTGPAADNGVRFANIMVDRSYAAGRNGLGLALAAKNLKYVAVKGNGKISVADPDLLKESRTDIFRLIATSPVLMGENGVAQFGTGAIFDLIDNRHMMPTANFRETHFGPAHTMNAVAYKRKYDTRRAGCKGCHILCKKVGRDGTHVPEFETMSHFSALIENDRIDTVVEANDLCNSMGMDTISAAGVLACRAEIEGIKLSHDQVVRALTDIGRGEGDGPELAGGSYRYAESKGRPELAMTVKKQELPAYDPRGAYGMALGYATSTRGGCHLRAYPISHEILRKPVPMDRFSFEGKARIVKIAEDANAIVDSLTACKFVFFAGSLEEYSRAFTAVTGHSTTAHDLLNTGERIYYHERMMNAANGFTIDDDDLPPRFFTEPGSDGVGLHIAPIDRAGFAEARANYYRVRGLDARGMPVPSKVEELGLNT